MGQEFSSQRAATQKSTTEDTQEEESPGPSSSDDEKPVISPPRVKSTLKPTENGKKRKASDGEDEVPSRGAKKIKGEGKRQLSQAKKRKSIPQHVRGTAIRPMHPHSEEKSQVKAKEHVTEQVEDDLTESDTQELAVKEATIPSDDLEEKEEEVLPKTRILAAVQIPVVEQSSGTHVTESVETEDDEQDQLEEAASEPPEESAIASESSESTRASVQPAQGQESTEPQNVNSYTTPPESPLSAADQQETDSSTGESFVPDDASGHSQADSELVSPRATKKRNPTQQHHKGSKKRSHEGQSNADIETPEKPSPKRQKKKRTSKALNLIAEDEPVPTIEHWEEPVAKRQKKKKATKAPDVVTIDRPEKSNERGRVTGTWSEEEKRLADQIFDRVCHEEDLTPGCLKALIMDWAGIAVFKPDILEAFPRRTYAAIRKFCQRRYTPFVRGPWTAEQDEKLLKAYPEYPDQWATISEFVDRFWQDCRDRYRNVLKYRDTMERGPWSSTEEVLLTKAVEECLEVVKENCEDAQIRDDPDRLQSMIDWATVAKKLEGKRSAKRCHEKWQKLKHRKATDAKPTNLTDEQSQRLKKAKLHLSQCEPGDIFDILTEISTAVDDRNSVFHNESTFWAIVATKHPESRFNGALRRLAFYTALTDYSCKQVKKATTVAAKAEALAARMTTLEQQGKLAFDRNYKPAPKKQMKVQNPPKSEARVFGDDLPTSPWRMNVMAWMDDAEEETYRMETPDLSPEGFLARCTAAATTPAETLLSGISF